jgi:gamma-glutamyltranspeptidase/glutathione hydrolase
MVSSPNYLASDAGAAVLRRGGTAIDGAIAAAAVLSVVYPHMCSIGGDNFWLIWDARARALRALNGSGRSGARCSIEAYAERGVTGTIPYRGFLAANTVPGAVDGWGTAYAYSREALGSSMPWADLLQDAIGYAEGGYPVTPGQEFYTALNLEPAPADRRNLQCFEGFRRSYLAAGARAPRHGEVLRQPQLARTLEAVARHGARAFYEGPIARQMAAYLEAGGGLLGEQDFAAHHSDWVEPLRIRYRDVVAVGFPPNTQGLAALSILNILNHFDVRSLGEGTADYVHALVEATKLAFADRDRWVTDPAFLKAPTDRLLDPAYGRDRARQIRMDRAGHYPPGDVGGDTVFLAAVDEARNAVALIQSIYHDFGSAIVAGDTGVLLQNRGAFFSLDPKHPNRLEPRKRTFHTLIPAMLLREGRPLLVYGTMGGEGQPQTQAAIVTRILDFGMNVQEAIEAPRWLYGRTWGEATGALQLEGRFPEAVTEDLARRGHPVRRLEDWTDTMGHAQGVQIDPTTGILWGGADPRGDGAAIGF